MKEESTDLSEVEWPVDDQIKDMEARLEACLEARLEARLEVLRTIKMQEDRVKEEKASCHSVQDS